MRAVGRQRDAFGIDHKAAVPPAPIVAAVFQVFVARQIAPVGQPRLERGMVWLDPLVYSFGCQHRKALGF